MSDWLTDLVEPNESRVIAFNAYVNEEGTEIAVVQIHPDADSMLFHMQLLSKHITGAYEDEGPLAETISIELYGDPGDAALEMIKQFNPGLPIGVKPYGLGGFTRSVATSATAAP